MLPLPDLLSLLQTPGQNPMVSGGGFGGGQNQGGTFDILSLLAKNGNNPTFANTSGATPTQNPSGGFLNNLFSGGQGGGLGGMFEGGGSGNGTSAMSGVYSMAGDIGGNLLTKKGLGDDGIINDGEAKLAGAVKGAGKGAAIGSVIPGVGTLIGAGVGALAGGIFGKGNEAEVHKRNNEIADQRLDLGYQHAKNRSNVVASNYNIHGQKGGYFMAKGGYTPSDYKVEDGEVIYASDDNPPITDGNGEVKRIGENTYKFSGDKHSDSSGGIGVVGGNTPFQGNDGDAEPSGFVFSDKLKADPSTFLSGL